MRKSIAFSIIVIFGILCSQETPQRQQGVIEGIVFNAATKEPIVGANVQIIGTTFGSATDIDGKFRIKNLPIGNYQVRTSALGFEPHIHTDVVVAAGKQTQLNIDLRETVLEFEEVTVTGEYFTKTPDAPVSVQTLDAEEIRRLPGGFEDVVRAVSILPGVAQAEAGRNDLIVRGGAPSENLFVIDNIEASNINHFGNQGASGGPLSFVNLDFVNETSFKAGGFGVKYGDKLSSVLTIDLKNGRTDRLGGKATISASQFGLNLEGPTDENGSFLFSARRSYLDFIFKAAGFGFVPEYWDFLTKINYKLSPKDQLTLLGITALDNVKYFNDTEDQRYENSRVLGSDQNQFIGGITWRHLLTNGFSNVTVSQTYVGFEYQQNDSLLNPLFRSSSGEYETSLRGDIVYQLNKGIEISAGALAKRVGFNSSILLPPFTTSFGETVAVNADLDTVGIKSAAYAQLSFSMMHNLRITVGGRMDYFDLIKENVAFSPRLSASYAFSPVLVLSASIGKFNQAPSYIWLVANPANRNLKFISVNQNIIGIEYFLRSDTKFSIETYQKNYTNYPASIRQPFLVLSNTGAGFGGSEEGFASFGLDPLTSAGSGTSRGAEVFLQKKLSELPYYGLISISISESRFKGLDGIERSGSFDQRWILNLGGGYIFNELWELGGKFRYAAGRPYTPYNLDGTQNTELYNTKRIVANHSLDLRLDRRWNFDNWNLITYIDVQNVYNRRTITIPQYDKRERKEVENESGIGILPSIGISAEW